MQAESYSKWLQVARTKRLQACHDKLCSHLHWCLSKKYGIHADGKWHHHQPEKVVENDVVKILWDYNIQTDRIIENRRPDLTVVDKTGRNSLLLM